VANLDYNSFVKDLRTVLSLRGGADEAALKVIIQATIRDVIREFNNSIGSRTDRRPFICNEEIEDGTTVTRIYLADDAVYIKSAFLNGIEIVPIDITEEEIWLQSAVNLNDNTIVEIPASIQRTEDGQIFLQLIPLLTLNPESPPRAVINYAITTSDVSFIPEAFKNLIIYGCIRHYNNWYLTDQPDTQSKSDANYRDYLKMLRAELGNENTHIKRTYEIEWERLFRVTLEGNTNDLNVRGI
jgi:hypothetical protein